MFIGVPIFAVIYDVFGKLMRFCLHKRGEHEELKTYENEYLAMDDDDAETFFKRKMAEWRDEFQKKMQKSQENGDDDGETKPETAKPAKRKTKKTSAGSSKKKQLGRKTTKKEPDDVVDGVELTQVTFSDEGHDVK